MTDAPMTPDEFEQAFASADATTRTAFVADLWEALGWETSTEGDVVVAGRSEPVSETRRLLVSTGERPPGEADADAVVTAEESTLTGADVPVIDAADIRDRALYGADRSATAPAFRRHFDRELATDPPGRGSDRGAPPDSEGDPPSGAAAKQPPVAGEDAPPEETDDAPGRANDAPGETNGALHEGGSGDDGSPEESGEASDPNAVTAGRAAGVLLVVALVVGGVGFAAGAGMLPPGAVFEDRATSPTTTTTATPDRDAVPNGSAARYASLRPTCERPPELVIKIQVDAFGRNDDLDGNTGIWTAYRFASPENRETTGPQASFARLIKQRYAIMLRHESVEYGNVRLRESGGGKNVSRTATQRVTLTDENGTETAFLWSVEKRDGGEYDGCWMTSSVARVS